MCGKTTLNTYSAESHDDNFNWWLDLRKPCSACGGLSAEPHSADEKEICEKCHGYGYALLERNVGELLMLIVAELAEALEGHRKGLMDDKLPHRTMLEVELADCVIRIFDFAGGYNLDLEGAYQEKRLYNKIRKDHKIESRLSSGGKKY